MTIESLANAELAVMELLWEGDRLTARQIRDELYPGGDRSANGTVQRLLQRLETKGFVERDRELPVHLFSALVGREAYAGAQLKSLAEQLKSAATRSKEVQRALKLVGNGIESESETQKIRILGMAVDTRMLEALMGLLSALGVTLWQVVST